ncbi:MAG: hypothetical protein AMXMBFR7_38480 [Planctomycetota bacterium]
MGGALNRVQIAGLKLPDFWISSPQKAHGGRARKRPPILYVIQATPCVPLGFGLGHVQKRFGAVLDLEEDPDLLFPVLQPFDGVR